MLLALFQSLSPSRAKSPKPRFKRPEGILCSGLSLFVRLILTILGCSCKDHLCHSLGSLVHLAVMRQWRFYSNKATLMGITRLSLVPVIVLEDVVYTVVCSWFGRALTALVHLSLPWLMTHVLDIFRYSRSGAWSSQCQCNSRPHSWMQCLCYEVDDILPPCISYFLIVIQSFV